MISLLLSPLTLAKGPYHHQSGSKAKKAPFSMSENNENKFVVFDTSANRKREFGELA
jgi:hypothetical protein